MKKLTFNLFTILKGILIWIFISNLICSEISNHYLGINANLSSNIIFINDKIKIYSENNWEFKLSQNAKNIEVIINGKKRKVDKIITDKNNSVLYSVKRFIWEQKSTILEIKYQIQIPAESKLNRFDQNQILLFADSYYYPTGNEKNSNFDLFIQISNEWQIFTEAKRLINKNSSNPSLHKFSSQSKIRELNIFGVPKLNILTKYLEPSINIINISSKKFNNDSLLSIIKFSIDNYVNKFGSFHNNDFSIIIGERDFFTTSSILMIDYNYIQSIIKEKSILQALLLPQWINTNIKNIEELEFTLAFLIYINQYSKQNKKNNIISKKTRQNILSAFTLDQNLLPKLIPYFNEISKIIPEFKKINFNKIYNNLFLFIILEEYSNINIIKKIKSLIHDKESNSINTVDLFIELGKNLPFNSKVIIQETNKALEKEIKPKLQLQILDSKIKLVQQGYVRPLIIPIQFEYSNGIIIDTLITSRSYSNTLYSIKKDSTINKINIDPNFLVFRSLEQSELNTKLNDFFLYSKIQIVTEKKLSPFLSIAKLIESNLPDMKVIHTNHDELNHNLPAIHIGYLPEDFTYLATNTDIIIEGKKFYSRSHSLIYTYLNSQNIPNIILYSKESEELSLIIKKIKRFGKYGYIVFRHGNNALKGHHKTNHSHLKWKSKK